jgi:HlyD family secretion protein
MADVIREKKARTVTVKKVAWAGAVVVAGGLGFCHFKPHAPRVSAQSLYIGTVQSGAMVVEIRGAGTLVPENTEWIPASTDGRVERILVQPGAIITPETVLIELTNPEVSRALQDAELQVRAGEAELRSKRLEIESAILAQEAVVAAARVEWEEARGRARADAELAQSGLTSALTLQSSRGREQQLAVRANVEQKRFDLARQSEHADIAAAMSRLDQQRATLQLRRQQVGALQVRAARGGVLQQVAVEVGARVSGGANLARVAAPEPLKAVVQVSQVDASQIAPGQRVRIDTHEGIIDGAISRVDPSVQNGSVTVDVRLPSQLPRGARPDLSVDAAIEIDRADNALHVNRPVQAMANTSITLFRLSEDGSEAERVPVQIGRTSYNAIEVLSGLRRGDRVVLSDTSAFDKFDRITISD